MTYADDEIRQVGPAAVQDDVDTEALAIVTADGKSHQFNVEIARTPPQQAYGLMNRKSMSRDHGMLFTFQTEAGRSFWMKNTLIPLDMVFIKADGTIHHIHENAVPHDLTPVLSNGPVRAVLEVNGGRMSALGIRPGDKVRHKFFDASSP
ncbi:MAG: DUF192 domain-containing protein [Micavibrio aeruginosavorus]|uniref:DUF192 domain-containing protein n=1 Tax=Micavibrio aeruginosavorus TaxID=349221 RepID=A0A7T5R4R6_9BACT|nr:MAG: DUF192 domain-containing protein [Micavibrio aeruginosavorus]